MYGPDELGLYSVFTADGFNPVLLINQEDADKIFKVLKVQ